MTSGVMAMPRKQRRYVSELANPIVWPALPTFEGAVTAKRVKEFWGRWKRDQRDAERNVAQALLRKISLLMKHHGIADERDMAALVWALASEHVPGFKIVPETKTKRGRKKEWDGLKLQELYDAVHSVKKNHNYNDRQAIKFISSNYQYSAEWGPPATYTGSKKQWVETLESRLQDAKKYATYVNSLPEFFKNIRADMLRAKFRK
jgi:hypothetical protein